MILFHAIIEPLDEIKPGQIRYIGNKKCVIISVCFKDKLVYALPLDTKGCLFRD
jgi:hypothetical protein